MELRDYQTNAITAIRSSIGRGNKKPLLVSPTGSGKTAMGSEIVKCAVEKKNRVLFLAPRRELIYQASATFHKAGILHGIIMAGEPMAEWRPVQVASFDTLHARGVRGEIIDMPYADVVIVDEAHLSVAKTRKDIIDHYGDKIIIGMTATPARGDGRGLGEIYDDMVISTNVRDLTEQGYLVPVRYFAPSKPDLEGLKLNKDGDYAEKGLAGAVDKAELIGDVVHNWQRIASDRQTVVFAVNRAHSRHIRDEFRRAGYRAEHLDGETPLDERKEILERVANGTTQILCNVFVATFGLDIPSLSCAVLARPTKNIALYLQTAGRVLRPCEGKTDAVIIDHAGAIAENGFVDDIQPWSLDSNSKVKDRKKQQQEQNKTPKDITCARCKTVFSGQRFCPNCQAEVIGKAEDIPTHQADLQEVKREKAKENRNVSKEEKQQFYSELLGYCYKNGKNEGFAAHTYRRRFGVWPNAMAKVSAEPTAETSNYIKHTLIANAKRRAAA